jgi:uncharacterized membrane protein
MDDRTRESSETVLKHTLDRLSEREKQLIQKLLRREPVSRDIGQEFQEGLTVGQKLSDSIAHYAGSWPFIIFFFGFLGTWILINSLLLPSSGKAFDPYPYILLNLFLSMLAAVQAPIILMSANRQAAKDRAEAAHDYEINLKAELEVMSLHTKIDQMREEQLDSIVKIQEQQLLLLKQISDILAETRGDGPPETG